LSEVALVLVWVTMILVLLVVEKQRGWFFFPVAGLLFVTSVFLVAVGDLMQASLLGGTFMAVVVFASLAKVRLLGTTLNISDFGWLAHGDIGFLGRAYSRVVWTVALAATLLAAIDLAIVFGLPHEPIGLGPRLAICVAASAGLIAAYRRVGGDWLLQAKTIRGARPFSTFISSCLDAAIRGRSGPMQMTNISEQPYKLPEVESRRPALRPDIVVIQHESTFDPRLYGLPIGAEVAGFLGDSSPIAGPLHVDCFGAHSWQSEFAFVTGLSSREFEVGNWEIFHQGAGRFRHTLPFVLQKLGYSTAVANTARSGYLNSDTFYRLAGLDRRLFAEDLFEAKADRRKFERCEHDGTFFDAAVTALCAEDDGRPRYVMLLTNYNHASHKRRCAPPTREAEREFAFAASQMAEYAEYYARLAEAAACYAALKRQLAERNPGKPIMFVRYGDHQPALARQLMERHGLAPDDPKQFETFYAIESLNFELGRPSIPSGEPLDLAFLSTVLLEAARLPLDGVFRARAALMTECCSTYFANPSPIKPGIHRALLDAGLIRLA
jgi:hypothetical protein